MAESIVCGMSRGTRPRVDALEVQDVAIEREWYRVVIAQRAGDTAAEARARARLSRLVAFGEQAIGRRHEEVN